MTTQQDKPLDLKKIVTEFVGILRGVVNEVSELYPKDPEMALYKQRINLVLTTNPNSAVTEVGLQLLRYRHQILAGDDTFFMREGTIGEEKEMESLFNKLREAWKNMPAPKQQRYKSLVKTLLYLYSDYMKC